MEYINKQLQKGIYHENAMPIPMTPKKLYWCHYCNVVLDKGEEEYDLETKSNNYLN